MENRGGSIMASWLTDPQEARRKPVRTLLSTMICGFITLAFVDYFLAGTRSIASAGAVGGVAAIMIGLGISHGLWPGIFDRPLTAPGRGRTLRSIGRWYFLVICVFMSFTLIGLGISSGRADVIVAGAPFLLIGAVMTLARRRFRR
jgi:hypothetical protein